MRSVFLAAALTAAVLSCSSSRPTLAAQRSATLQRLITAYHAGNKFPGGVVAVSFDDGTTVVAASGVADRSRGTPMQTDALLHAGSVGKTLFAAYALQLVGDGRLELDAPVSRYLGTERWYAAIPNASTITVRMLLNHTTGVPEFGSSFMSALVKDPGKRRTPLEALQSVAGATPKFAAGTRFAYSDVNYQLLQLVEERVTGRSAYDGIQEFVLKPFGLKRIVPATSRRIPGLIPGYAGDGFFLGFDAVMGDSGLVLDPTFEGGGGGFVANVADLARWMAIVCDGRPFPARLLPDMRRGVPAGELDVGNDASVGLGVELVQTPYGPACGHGGFFPGYVSLVLSYPERGVSVAVQVNSSASDALKQPMREFIDEVVQQVR